MAHLKLAKLPDRTPIRITITIDAGLNQALNDYQRLYAATYGASEKVADLIPFMLEAFLDSDRAFSKARKEGVPEVEPDRPARRGRASRASGSETKAEDGNEPSSSLFASPASPTQED
ncbi:DUF2274 domain-containing protein [Roseibium aggregatum]|uniref:DUF2274 domain-containing protein n=1 Tax=Roseibium aggregatum TaxID=187304 RepID=A0A926NYD1_9HYPH|nr:DUF2274 domain-containing protein [Roseibium aggregatum]